MVRIMLDEVLTFVKLLINTKANILFFFVVLAIFAVTGSSIAFNIIKQQQVRAVTNDLGNSLSNIIREKVSDSIKKSFSGINQQSSSTTNQQTTKQSSISGANRSTNVNCTNGRCITTTCTDNNCTTTIQNSGSGTASSSSAPSITNITIGEPFYKQNDKSTNQKAVIVNGINASRISFSGNGTANSINFRDTGKALIIPRAGGATYIQGNAELVNINNSSEKATYTFQEIGQLTSDGMIKANGAAFFGSNATGKLAFLNNVVAIYHDQIDKAGNSKLTAWKWK
jgi:hypothetical protein